VVGRHIRAIKLGVVGLLGTAGGSALGGDIFARPGLVPLQSRPAVIHAADLNADGWLDLVTAQSSSGEVSVLLNTGGSAGRALFAEPLTYEVGLSPLAVESGDVDQQNGLDLLVVNSGSADASILLNRGDGRFEEGARLDLGVGPRVGKLGDVNRDGHLDAVAGTVSSKEVQVFLGDGSGRFPRKLEVTIGGNPHAIALEDFDGDELLDLLAVYANNFVGGVQWLQGNGDGTFRAPVKTSLSSVNDAVPRLIATGDFNEDGLLDAGVVTDDELLLSLEFERSGRFNVTLVGKLAVPRAEFLARGDFDADGRLDLMAPVQDGGNAGVRIYRRVEAGGFALLGDIFLQGALLDLLLADLDKDGALDLACAQSGPNGVNIVRGTGPGRLGVRAALALGASPRCLGAIDSNGDGVSEVAAISSGSVHLVRGVGAGGLERFARRDFGGRAFEDLAMGRFGESNGQGLALLDIAREEIVLVSVAENGELSAGMSFSAGDLPRRMAAADLDADGTSDLAVTSLASEELSLVLLHREGGGVAARVKVSVDSPQTAVDAADVDGDGLLDLCVGTKSGVKLLINRDRGSAYEVRTVPGYSSPGSIRAFASAQSAQASLALALGESVVVVSALGDAREAAPLEINLAAPVESLLMADADGDGLHDVLAGVDGAVAFSRARPEGGYDAPDRYPVGSTPRAIALASLLPGGRMDCATADFESKEISVLAGSGTPRSFGESFRRGDADGDGSLLITDAINVLYALFATGNAIACLDAADADDSGEVNLTDVVRVLDHLFRGGPSPAAPAGKDCGVDPTRDELGCGRGCDG